MHSFTGAGISAAGSSGLVPAPNAGDFSKFLRADGQWAAVTGGGVSGNFALWDDNSVVVDAGFSLADLGLSSKANISYVDAAVLALQNSISAVADQFAADLANAVVAGNVFVLGTVSSAVDGAMWIEG